MNLLNKIFPSRNDRELKRLNKILLKVNTLESSMAALSDTDLKAKTSEFRARLKEGARLNDLLPEAFAVVREAGKRVLGMRHFDVQHIGGMVLHSGKIAEMRTGEGKTLVATLPVYLNALEGKGVHVITVNDYLAKRDAEWMKPLYEFLGLRVGLVISGMGHEEKQAAYAADITHGTNNEFVFDYLRDNMVHSLAEKVQRPLHFAIIDEVDSVLIDEARTPCIISGQAEDSSALYIAINKIIPQLTRQEEKEGPGDYSVDLKTRQVFLTEDGHKHVEEILAAANLIAPGESLYDVKNILLMHHIGAGLRAHAIFHRDVDYIVRDGEVIIVDEHTGRTLIGRRWSEGLHQAVEAKEGVAIQNENQTMASISFQNYFRLYEKLGGMTGTADTEAYEFQQIYRLEVIVIPTNRQMRRVDEQDQIFLTKEEKFKAVIDDIKRHVEKGAPVLVGTVSIENSELVSEKLKQEGIAHQVLNAKFHEKEAHIIAQAGKPSAVTIATNMAGRGTDIVLGGNPEFEIGELENPTEETIATIRAAWKVRHQQVVDAGGLRIIGTERHESRRIDNQLRGRAGRQGDPGSSCFYISMEDDLMVRFMGENMRLMLKKLGMGNGEPISAGLISSSIEKAQRKVEAHNFDARKSLIEYDDVANEQRKIIYKERNELLGMNDLGDEVSFLLTDVVKKIVDTHIPENSMEEQWDVAGLEQQFASDFGLQLHVAAWLAEDGERDAAALLAHVENFVKTAYEKKKAELGPEMMKQLEKSIMLQRLDAAWLDHLNGMDHLRQGIHLRGYAQKNPKQEYKREAFEMFEAMLNSIKYELVSYCFRVQLVQHREEEPAGVREPLLNEPPLQPLSRNQACPCGSGKRYKECHGKISP